MASAQPSKRSVCGNIRDDVLAAVHQVIERPKQPKYIVLEASGGAEPSGIAATIMGAGLRDHIRLHSLMGVRDAAQIFAARDDGAKAQADRLRGHAHPEQS